MVAPTQAEQQRRLSRQLQQGGSLPEFFNEAILGQTPLFAGTNFAIRGAGGLRSAADIAGQTGPGALTGEQQGTLQQFLSPSLQGGQQVAIERLAKRAAGQGLIGGAVQGQVQSAAQQFLAQNRAGAFGGVSNIIGERLGALEARAQPFLQQALGLTDILAGGLNAQNLRNVLGASGQTAGQFGQFAQPSLQALSAFGLGADAIAGVAQRQGATIGAGGITGNQNIGDAFVDFLNPQATGSRVLLAQQLGVPEAQIGDFLGSGARAGRGVGFRNLARAANRIGAAQFLAGEVGGRLSGFRQQATEFETLAGAAQAFTIGDRAAASQLINADVDRFQGLLGGLGITDQPQRQRAAQQFRERGGFVRGRFLPGGSALFRTVFG